MSNNDYAEDWVELGNTGWIPMPDGTYVNYKEGKIRDEFGNVYSLDGIDMNDFPTEDI